MEQDLPEVPVEDGPVRGDERSPRSSRRTAPSISVGPNHETRTAAASSEPGARIRPARAVRMRRATVRLSSWGRARNSAGRRDQGRQRGDPPATARPGAIRRSHRVSSSFRHGGPRPVRLRDRSLAPGLRAARSPRSILATPAPARARIHVRPRPRATRGRERARGGALQPLAASGIVGRLDAPAAVRSVGSRRISVAWIR